MKWFKRKEWIYVGSYQCGYTSYDLYVKQPEIEEL